MLSVLCDINLNVWWVRETPLLLFLHVPHLTTNSEVGVRVRREWLGIQLSNPFNQARADQVALSGGHTQAPGSAHPSNTGAFENELPRAGEAAIKKKNKIGKHFGKDTFYI